MSSRRDQKEQAKAAREAAEARVATDEARRRRLRGLAAIVVLAGVAVVVLIVVSSGGGGAKSVPAGGAAADSGNAPTLLGGIPQSGLTLGDPKAPVTIVEYNDMQCPVCREYTTAVFPTLVKRYVRTGRLRMEMRLQSFIGPDSVSAGKAVFAAGRQNLAWMFSDIFYANQQQENSGYVTDDFLRSIAAATPGLDAAKLLADVQTRAAATALAAGSRDFQAHGLTGTPSFLIGRTGGQLSVLRFSALTPAQFTGPVDSLLAK